MIEQRFFAPDEVARACLRALSKLICKDGQCLCMDPSAGGALDLVGDAVLVVDLRRRILHFNERASALTGYPPSEVLGRTCTEGLRCTNCTTGCSLFGEGEFCSRRLEIQARDGHRVIVVKDGRVLRDGEGRVVGGIETLHDITDIQQSQQAAAELLHARCRMMETFADELEEGLAALDDEGRIACLSSRGAQLLGVGADEVVGLPFAQFLADDSEFLRKLSFVQTTRGQAVLSGVVVRQPLARFGTLAIRLRDLPPAQVEARGIAVVFRREAPPGLQGSYFGIVGRSPAMRELLRAIAPLADSDATILLMGESGAGKEIVARALHLAGPRADQPFHAVNCAALSEDLLESELFGHDRGAFTGAVRDKPGRLELCGDGTLLLDEVGCMGARMQAKLLRVLETREFERVGGTRPRQFRARVLAATNSDLAELVRTGGFRADLYYRLRVVPLAVPPLRERVEDVMPLAHHFAEQLSRPEQGREPIRFTERAIDALETHSWPGNVRELRNAVQFALVMGNGRVIDLVDLHPDVRKSVAHPASGERERIETLLRECRFNRSEVAIRLGVDRTTLWRRMRKLGIH